MTIKRGDVYKVNFNKPDKPHESIIKYSVILQEGKIIENSPTVVCVNITTQKLDKIYPTDVFLEPSESKTTSGAKVICNQIHTIPKSRMIDFQYSLSTESIGDIDSALMLGVGIVKLEDFETTSSETTSSEGNSDFDEIG